MKKTLQYLIYAIENELLDLYPKEEVNAITKKYLLHEYMLSLADFLHPSEVQINVNENFYSNIHRLKKYEPLAYVLGYTYFGDCKILTNKNTLVPRPETEELVYLIKKKLYGQKKKYVLDACTGSGCISILLKKFFPDWQIDALDISQEAINLAKKTAEINDVNVNFYSQNVFDLDEKKCAYNLIVSNPPYVLPGEKQFMKPNVLMHEPHNAIFTSEDDPLCFYKKLGKVSTKMKNDGIMFLEINPPCAMELKSIMEKYFKDVKIEKDLANKERFMICKRKIQ